MPAGTAGVSSLISDIAQSVVSNNPLILAAFWIATLSTFVGTITPALKRFSISPVRPLNPNTSSVVSATF